MKFYKLFILLVCVIIIKTQLNDNFNAPIKYKINNANDTFNSEIKNNSAYDNFELKIFNKTLNIYDSEDKSLINSIDMNKVILKANDTKVLLTYDHNECFEVLYYITEPRDLHKLKLCFIDLAEKDTCLNIINKNINENRDGFLSSTNNFRFKTRNNLKAGQDNNPTNIQIIPDSEGHFKLVQNTLITTMAVIDPKKLIGNLGQINQNIRECEYRECEGYIFAHDIRNDKTNGTVPVKIIMNLVNITLSVNGNDIYVKALDDILDTKIDANKHNCFILIDKAQKEFSICVNNTPMCTSNDWIIDIYKFKHSCKNRLNTNLQNNESSTNTDGQFHNNIPKNAVFLDPNNILTKNPAEDAVSNHGDNNKSQQSQTCNTQPAEGHKEEMGDVCKKCLEQKAEAQTVSNDNSATILPIVLTNLPPPSQQAEQNKTCNELSKTSTEINNSQTPQIQASGNENTQITKTHSESKTTETNNSHTPRNQASTNENIQITKTHSENKITETNDNNNNNHDDERKKELLDSIKKLIENQEKRTQLLEKAIDKLDNLKTAEQKIEIKCGCENKQQEHCPCQKETNIVQPLQNNNSKENNQNTENDNQSIQSSRHINENNNSPMQTTNQQLSQNEIPSQSINQSDQNVRLTATNNLPTQNNNQPLTVTNNTQPIQNNNQPMQQNNNNQPMQQNNNNQPMQQNNSQSIQNNNQPMQNNNQAIQHNNQPILNNQQMQSNNSQSMQNNSQPTQNTTPNSNLATPDNNQVITNNGQYIQNAQPIQNNSQPMQNNGQPLINNNQPLSNTNQPMPTNYSQPLQNNGQPLINNNQPILNTNQLIPTNYSQPLQDNGQPQSNNNQPLTNYQPMSLQNNNQPIPNNRQPTTNNQFISYSNQPTITNNTMEPNNNQLIPNNNLSPQNINQPFENVNKNPYLNIASSQYNPTPTLSQPFMTITNSSLNANPTNINAETTDCSSNNSKFDTKIQNPNNNNHFSDNFISFQNQYIPIAMNMNNDYSPRVINQERNTQQPPFKTIFIMRRNCLNC
jgi:hypothetical protein